LSLQKKKKKKKKKKKSIQNGMILNIDSLVKNLLLFLNCRNHAFVFPPSSLKQTSILPWELDQMDTWESGKPLKLSIAVPLRPCHA
jgi:hypothetical protein